jgi:hypothetical protein
MGNPGFKFTLVDVFLGTLFGAGIVIFSFALYYEAKEKAPFYMILTGVGTMISFVATFMAAMKRQ